jgi:hypothetical protein
LFATLESIELRPDTRVRIKVMQAEVGHVRRIP